jgi:hypothetical protein
MFEWVKGNKSLFSIHAIWTHNQILLENQEPFFFHVHENHISTTNLDISQLYPSQFKTPKF